jgi:ubiquinone/menaquinone biosynthesis C-methylase UbiE
MPEEGSYCIDEIHRDIDQELYRLQVQTDLGWPKESRALTWFGLQDGMALLELGSGPGFVTGHLLDLVPHSVITCLEIDPVMIVHAERYLQDRRGDRVRIAPGSIMNIPLPDNVYDVAFARFLFQHLPDPIGAAREVRRVLRPGGKLVIHDIDADLGGLRVPKTPPEIEASYARAGQIQTQKGGNTRIGRNLVRILREAGYEALDLDLMIVHSDLVSLTAMAPLWDVEVLWPALKAEVITEADYEQARADRERFLASPDAIWALTLFLACGQKPMD